MELKDLEVFLIVAEYKSISKAASSIYMSQSSISERIKKLEADIGGALFIRTSSGVQLTDNGELFLSHVQQSLHHLKSGITAVKEGTLERETILIGTTYSIATHFLGKRLASLTVSDFDFKLYTGHSEQVFHMLLEGQIDVGFIITPIYRSGITCKAIFQDCIVCIANPLHQLCQLKEVFLADFSHSTIANVNWGPSYLRFLDLLGGKIDLRSNNISRVSPGEIAKTMVKENSNVISFLPLCQVQEEVLRGELKLLNVPELKPFEWEVHVIYREKKQLKKSLQELLSAIKAKPRG